MHQEPDGRYPGAPRWVGILGGVLTALILTLVILKLLGIGNHGPARHMPGADPPTPTDVEHP